MYSSQEPDSSQPRVEPYPPQNTYPSPEAASYPYPPQGAYPPPDAGPHPYPPAQPGMASYPYPPQGAYPPPGAAPYPYAPQGSYVPPGQKLKNSRATRAMIYGFISIFLAMITVLQQFGAAGVITGTFAIYYGFTALKIAKRFPGNPGRNQAIAAIVLGFVAWFLVIVSLIARSAVSGS